MIRRYGEPVRFGRRYQTRAGAYGILIRDGALLLTHQQHPIPEFQLPGGGVDANESLFQALHREVLEETGWWIAAPRRIGAFRRFTYMPEYDLWAEKICHVFVARPVCNRGAPVEPGHTAVWATPENASRILADQGSRAFVARYFSRGRNIPASRPKHRLKSPCHPRI